MVATNSEVAAALREAAELANHFKYPNSGPKISHKILALITQPQQSAYDRAIAKAALAARIEEAKWWRHLVIMHEESYFAVEGDKRIADLQKQQAEAEAGHERP